MRMFLSGVCQAAVEPVISRRMFSYFYYGRDKKTGKPNKRVLDARERGTEVFLDSGAYSAFTIGKKLCIKEYTEHCLQYREYYLLVAAFDAIGDADLSYKNYQWQKQQGLDVVPVFHHGEDFEFLKQLSKEAPYIGLGGVAQLGNQETKLVQWLDACWEEIGSQTSVHGFALGLPKILTRYPWTSVDSATWGRAASVGKITVHVGGVSREIGITEKEGHKLSRKTWSALGQDEQRVITELAASRGLTVADLSKSENARKIFNAHTYMQYEQLVNTESVRQLTLF